MPDSEAKLDRILHRHERLLQRMFQAEKIEPKKHKYYLMEIETSILEKTLNEYEKSSSNKLRNTLNLVSVREFKYGNENDHELFVSLYNLVLLTSPDPFRPMTTDDAKFFKKGTFLAFLYGKCVGYSVITTENTDQGKIGVIAGIGVHPQHRGKKIALKLALEIGKWFLMKDFIKLQCEVYEKNKVSFKFISSFGFKKVQEFYLE